MKGALEIPMAIWVSGIITGLDDPIESAFQKAKKILGLKKARCSVAKTSIDARRRPVRFVHTVSVETEDENKVYQRCKGSNIVLHQPQPMKISYGKSLMEYRPVIAGFGPAGMFCGLLLARCGYRPLILERGPAMEKRIKKVENFWETGILDPDANVQFGEGGAGTFSDGKLTTRIGDAKCDWVLQEFVKLGAPAEILYQAKPHIGTDLLRNVVANLRKELVSFGGEVRFETPFIDLQQKNGILSVKTPEDEIPASVLVLAVGHSARDTFLMLKQKGFAMEPKPFSVGVRIEHLQKEIDKGLYGGLAGHPALPPGEYQLSYREGERGVYTFCMCPGGVVVPAASQEEMVVTNGMSFHARNGRNANGAVAVSVGPADYGKAPLDGMRFQQYLEKLAFQAGGGKYRAPVQDIGHFLKKERGFSPGRIIPSYCLGVTEANFSALFPPFITDMLQKGFFHFSKKLPGFAAENAVLTGIETRTSSPVRILRQEDYQAKNFQNVYPCAEGAGYAGGIMSAAVDGLRVALAIMERFAPFS